MESWNHIINAAMIGTDKKTIGADDLPAGLTTAATIILANTETDKEEKFLQLSSLALNYRQCGLQALQKKEVTLSKAPMEEKNHCSINASQVLKDVLAEESIPLLKFWLQHCAAKNRIASPETLPALLDAGMQNKNLQSLIANCAGKRGEWLAGFNENWNFSTHQTTEEQWQTGTLEQRKAVLKALRQTDPAKAREFLQQTWQQEDAATKQSFLDLFDINLGDDDITFLESLQTDKSKKVKDAAINLLKQIPASAIVLLYKDVLKQAVQIKKEKALLGLSSKQVLHFQLPANISEAVFKTGIEKLSSNSKNFSDEEFILYQLIQSVPPSFWLEQFDENMEAVIRRFQQDTTGKKMMPALVIAVCKFKDQDWASALMQHSETFYIDIIPLLSAQQQEHYSNRFFTQHPDSIIQYATQREDEWGAELTKNIFIHTAKNYYQYNKSFYNQQIHLIPDRIAIELEKCTPQEEYQRSAWSNTSDYILKLLQLKAQIKQSFNE